MQEEKIVIGTPGIKHALRKFDALRAISEFIWNGFDAGASVVNIEYEANEIGFIPELRIIDNGSGIPRPELNETFGPFMHKNQVIDPAAMQHGPSAIHGKTGVGRLTFFKFARNAEWETTYEASPGKFKQYKIEIQADRLQTFSPHQESDSQGPTGTIVRFTNLIEITAYSFDTIKEFLASEFCWFLELRSPFEREIRINGEVLSYDDLVGDRETFDLAVDNKSFSTRYVRWNERPHDEYSRYYFIGSDNCERAKKHTTLNNKGDGFYHSVFVQSDYFDSIKEAIVLPDSNNGDNQMQLPLTNIEREDIFRELMKKLDEFLREKRRPFLRQRAIRFVQELEDEGMFPEFSTDLWDQRRKDELGEVVRELYVADPRIFNNLSDQQKQTLVQLFSLVMNSSERDALVDILSQIVNLESKDRAELARILRATQLSNIINTIKMIYDRFTAVDELKKMVFNPEFGANEREHLQTFIERHYWLFGEQYHLVTAAEPDFEQALRRFLHYLYGEDKPRSIDHPDKNKEMDIFAVRWLPQAKEINNIVVELKHPNIKLGDKELTQVKKYMSVVLEQPQFNASNMSWEFFLVGTDYNDYIAGELESAKANGEKHLVHKRTNYKIFVLKWSDVITNFELRHNFILERLKIERDKIASDAKSADEVLAKGHESTASMMPRPIAV